MPDGQGRAGRDAGAAQAGAAGDAEAAASAQADAELARVMSMLPPPVRRPPLRRSTCLAAMALFVVASMFAIFALGWLEEPQRAVYSPIAHPVDALTMIGGRCGIMLPGSWQTGSPLSYRGPGGATLVVEHGTLRYFDMQPRTFGSRTLSEQYNTATYLRSLRGRFGQASAALFSRYAELEELRGVEAGLRCEDGLFLRGFAVVQGVGRDVTELLFRLPEGPGSPCWQEAEAIFRSLQAGIVRKPVPAGNGGGPVALTQARLQEYLEKHSWSLAPSRHYPDPDGGGIALYLRIPRLDRFLIIESGRKGEELVVLRAIESDREPAGHDEMRMMLAGQKAGD